MMVNRLAINHVFKNAQAVSEALKQKGYRIVTGGTDNHLLLVDLSNRKISGKDAADWLDKAMITVNKNLIPFDKQSAGITSGIRLGTPAVTTRGMKERQMRAIADLIDKVLTKRSDSAVKEAQREVNRLTKQFPLYKGLI